MDIKTYYAKHIIELQVYTMRRSYFVSIVYPTRPHRYRTLLIQTNPTETICFKAARGTRLRRRGVAMHSCENSWTQQYLCNIYYATRGVYTIYAYTRYIIIIVCGHKWVRNLCYVLSYKFVSCAQDIQIVLYTYYFVFYHVRSHAVSPMSIVNHLP